MPVKKQYKPPAAQAEKWGIKKYAVSKAKEKIKNDKREDLLKIIDAGTDVSNFGDPSSWQRETRGDRNFQHSYK